MCARLGALTADVGKETCDFLNGASAPVAADDTEEQIVNLASEELQKSSLAHLKRLWTLEHI